MRKMTERDSDKSGIVIDTYAWIEYFRGSAEGIKAKKFIEGNSSLFTPSIVIAEMSDKYRREGIAEWDIRKKFITVKSKIIDLNESIADKSGELKQEMRRDFKDIGLADAIVAAHSYILGARILTGDKHLRNMD